MKNNNSTARQRAEQSLLKFLNEYDCVPFVLRTIVIAALEGGALKYADDAAVTLKFAELLQNIKDTTEC